MSSEVGLTACQVIEGVLTELRQRYPYETIRLPESVSQVIASDCDHHRDRFGYAIYDEVTILAFRSDRWAFACQSRTEGYPANTISMSLMVLRLEGWLGCERFTGEPTNVVWHEYRQAYRREESLVVMKAHTDGTFECRNVAARFIPKNLEKYVLQHCEKVPFGHSSYLFETAQSTRYDPTFVTFLTDWLVDVLARAYHPGDFPYVGIR